MKYLASPYTHDNPDVKKERFEAVCEVASYMMLKGEHVFSPIAHTYPIAVHGGVPTDWDFWGDYDKEFLNFCEELIILMLPGWKESVGVTAEIEYMRELGKKVSYTFDGKDFYETPQEKIN